MVTSLYESKNRCYFRSRIAEAKFRQIIRFFAMDFTASDTAKLTNISVRSIHTIYIKLHKKIAVQCEKISPFNGIVELDESYFDARRVRGKRGRGASSKTIVFGLLKRDGNVYTEIVPDCSKATLQGIIRGHLHPYGAIHRHFHCISQYPNQHNMHLTHPL